MSIKDLYQELIIDHGSCPRNFYDLEDPDAKVESYNPLCGDKITLFLSIKDNKIIKASFQGHGCAISTASASMMTEELIDKNIEQALQLFMDFTKNITENTYNFIENPEQTELPNTFSDKLKQLPDKLLALTGVKNYPSRVKCATLAWHTLHLALKELKKDS